MHNIVGLQHASKAIYEAALRSTPMLVLGGTGPLDASHRRPWIDWIHTAQVQAQIVRDYVKWDDQPQGAQSVAESLLRAYQIAMTDPKGPVYLCFDVELQESLVPADFQLPDLAYYRLRQRLQATRQCLLRWQKRCWTLSRPWWWWRDWERVQVDRKPPVPD